MNIIRSLPPRHDQRPLGSIVGPESRGMSPQLSISAARWWFWPTNPGSCSWSGGQRRGEVWRERAFVFVSDFENLDEVGIPIRLISRAEMSPKSMLGPPPNGLVVIFDIFQEYRLLFSRKLAFWQSNCEYFNVFFQYWFLFLLQRGFSTSALLKRGPDSSFCAVVLSSASTHEMPAETSGTPLPTTTENRLRRSVPGEQNH